MSGTDIDRIVEHMSTERIMIAFERAQRSVGGVAECEDPAFMDAFHYHLRKIACADLLGILKEEDIVEVTDCLDDGERRWSLLASAVAS